MHCGESEMIRRSKGRKLLKLTIGRNNARRYVLEQRPRQCRRIHQPGLQREKTNIVFRIIVAIGPSRHVASSVGQRSFRAVGSNFDSECSTCRSFERDEERSQTYSRHSQINVITIRWWEVVALETKTFKNYAEPFLAICAYTIDMMDCQTRNELKR